MLGHAETDTERVGKGKGRERIRPIDLALVCSDVAMISCTSVLDFL